MEVSSCPTLPLSWVPNCPVPNCPVSKCPVPSCPVSSCPGFVTCPLTTVHMFSVVTLIHPRFLSIKVRLVESDRMRPVWVIFVSFFSRIY